METLARRLAAIDELETWKLHCHGYSAQDKQSAFERAQPLWVKRKISEGTLYLHPDVIAELTGQDWVPNDLQKRMIWASVLASAEGVTSRERFKTIKTCILKKYGRDWWEDVYLRQKHAFAAKERIRKQSTSNGPVVNMLIANTLLFGEAARDQVKAALSMIPKD